MSKERDTINWAVRVVALYAEQSRKLKQLRDVLASLGVTEKPDDYDVDTVALMDKLIRELEALVPQAGDTR